MRSGARGPGAEERGMKRKYRGAPTFLHSLLAVATALSEGEAKPKHCVMLEVKGQQVGGWEEARGRKGCMGGWKVGRGSPGGEGVPRFLTFLRHNTHVPLGRA